MNILNNYYKGFNNIGNTCYLNSGLQLFINNKELCNILLQNTSDNEIIHNINNIIITYYNNPLNIPLNTIYIKENISKLNKVFCGNTQNDSFEFIIYFFELINNINLYELHINCIVKCKLKSCLNINTTIEKSNFLLLDINNNSWCLDDCYRNFKISELLYSDNKYYCDKCKDKRIASKKYNISKWPKHLIIVLKRFIHNNNSIKNNKEIIIPLEWRHNYKLKGIIFHSGTTTSGHYVYIGNHNNKWILFNDDNTKELLNNQLDNYKNYGYIYYFT